VKSFIDSETAAIAASAGVTSLVDEIEATTFRDGIRVDVVTKHPGVLIGPRGATVETMRSGLGELLLRPVYLNVIPAVDVTRAESPPDV
jgi:ribosomal protein S3